MPLKVSHDTLCLLVLFVAVVVVTFLYIRLRLHPKCVSEKCIYRMKESLSQMIFDLNVQWVFSN